MSTLNLRKIPFKAITSTIDVCKTCIHFVKGKCTLFYNFDAHTAKDYYCYGLFKKVKRGFNNKK